MRSNSHIQIHTSPETKKLLESAATLSQVSVSAFVIQHALRQADEVLLPDIRALLKPEVESPKELE
jgi:uncharacterized protein (DUF1778 family)